VKDTLTFVTHSLNPDGMETKRSSRLTMVASVIRPCLHRRVTAFSLPSRVRAEPGGAHRRHNQQTPGAEDDHIRDH